LNDPNHPIVDVIRRYQTKVSCSRPRVVRLRLKGVVCCVHVGLATPEQKSNGLALNIVALEAQDMFVEGTGRLDRTNELSAPNDRYVGHIVTPLSRKVADR
jgi:hypothetical protein